MALVFRGERRKLLAQLSTRVLALVCIFGPFAFAAVLSQQSGVPADTLLGVWVHTSGYAVSFVVLGFAGYLGFPVLAGVLAGDLFASEDRYGTWKTVLTRSRSRSELFAGKLLAAATFAIGLVALLTLSSVLAGLLVTGDQPLVGLSGTLLSSSEGLWLALASWLLSVPPVLAFTSLAVLFSVASRSGIVGVLGPILVGLLMQLLALIGRGAWVHALLVASAFDDWHGLLTAPRFYGPLIIGNGVCILWVLVCLGASWMILRRRDFAGPPISRRPGWVAPVLAVLCLGALVVALGAASNLRPVAITKARLDASIARAFSNLTRLQQQELGRVVPRGAQLRLRASCRRRSASNEGPGDDWTCTMDVAMPQPGPNPFALTPVVYDMSVKSNGCYKAGAPPSFVGQQRMVDAHGQSVVNPLFTIYGCFDTTGRAARCPRSASCGGAITRPGTSTTGRSATKSTKAPSPARKAELEALRKAEREAGPARVREITEAEKQEQREAEQPAEEPAPSEATK